MSNISSINFKKSTAIQTAHNDRTLAPNYLISDIGCECNRNDTEARELKNKIVKEAIDTYTNRLGQKFQGKNFEWSAVVNIKPDTTMQDLENLSKKFNEKYGFQCYQIAIHRDEGHINEQNEKVINHHAHLEFVMLDKETGKTNFKLRDFNKEKMREIQTEVAEALKMERGQDKRLTKRERVEPRAYAALKEDEKKEKKQEDKNLTKKAISQELEKIRKSLIGKGYDKSIFRALNSLKDGEYTTEDLSLAIETVFTNYENELENKDINSSQTNRNLSKTNENNLRDESIELNQKEVLNAFTDDFRNGVEVIETGVFKKSYKIELKEEFKEKPQDLEDIGLFNKTKNKLSKLFEKIKEQATRILFLEKRAKDLIQENKELKAQIKQLKQEKDKIISPKQQEKEITTQNELGLIPDNDEAMQKIRDSFKPKGKNTTQRKNRGMSFGF